MKNQKFICFIGYLENRYKEVWKFCPDENFKLIIDFQLTGIEYDTVFCFISGLGLFRRSAWYRFEPTYRGK